MSHKAKKKNGRFCLTRKGGSHRLEQERIQQEVPNRRLRLTEDGSVLQKGRRARTSHKVTKD